MVDKGYVFVYYSHGNFIFYRAGYWLSLLPKKYDFYDNFFSDG